MSWQPALTGSVILGALALLLTGKGAPDVVLLGAVLVLLIAGVITPAEALEGFSNTGMITVAALFVVAAGLRETGGVTLLANLLLGRPRTDRGALLRLVPPVLAGSAFLNNTTIVAALMPAVNDWARRSGVPSSKLLLPLSYAAILGGLITLIGTSTNLVVAGLVDDRLADTPGLHALSMFEPTSVGLPIALVGGAIMVLLAPVLLPDRRPAVSLADDPRRFTMELVVPAASRLAGRSIEEAGLRSLPGAYLMELVRGDEVKPAVEPTERLMAGDRLIFAGDVEAMVDLQRTPGLEVATNQVFKLEGERHERVLVEAVVSERNRIVGQTIREGNFRTVYKAAVIAVARAGARIRSRIGDIALQPGDVLLLEAHPDFVKEQRARVDFYLVSPIPGATPPRSDRTWLGLAVLGFMVALSTFEVLPTVTSALLAAAATIVLRCCTVKDARRSMEWPVLIAIGASFGLGNALRASGLDQLIASGISALGTGSPLAALAATYVLTVVITEMITNNAAAVLAFPLGIALAQQLGVSPMPFVMAVMVGASASFLTPIGYQTNLMVYGPGGYKMADYLRFGLPITLVTGALALWLIPIFWPF